MTTATLTCTVCGFVPKTPTERALKVHMTREHGDSTSEGAPKTANSVAKNARAELALVGILQQLWPKGIPTADSGELLDALHLIDLTRDRLRGK